MTKGNYTNSVELKNFGIFQNKDKKRTPLSIGLEITARCNNNCRHCYINLPSDDKNAQSREMTFADIKKIIDEAVEMGTLWCGITGGEPLLRDDFGEIYLYIKKKGLLVSVLTNATLVTKDHINLFKKYTPRHLEISVYGITKQTYEKISRIPGSFEKFNHGLNLLLDGGFKVIFKIIAMQANKSEIDEIIKFCNGFKNTAIRLSTDIHAGINKKGTSVLSQRIDYKDIDKKWQVSGNDKIFNTSNNFLRENQFGGNLFLCSAGMDSFWIDSTGSAHICSLMRHPDFSHSLINNIMKEYWNEIIPDILSIKSDELVFKNNCGSCEHRSICEWCPAKSCLNTGHLYLPIDYYCSKIKNKNN